MFGDLALNAAYSPLTSSRRRRRLLPRWGAGVGVLLLAFVLAITGQPSLVRSAFAAPGKSIAAAAGGTGTGGTFNPLQTRLVDTRNGTGGFSTPLSANAWRGYTVAGVGGIPATGVTSVVVTLTVLGAGTNGTISLAPNTSLPASPVTFLLFNNGETVSNSGVVDVGTDGKIAVQATAAVNVLIDVQGYFTAGNGAPAPGGYVSANNTRIVNTATGVGGATGPLAPNSSTTFAATGGSTGIPTTATAIYANITISNTSTSGNYVTPYATGTAKPGTSLNYPGAPTSGVADATALGATIDLNSSGQFNLFVGGSVQVSIDVQGYFDGEPSTSGFTPLNARIFDSRSPSVPLPAGAVTTVQVGGVGGIPAGSSSLAGVAMNVQVLPGAAGGYLRIWSGDQPEPTSTSTINFDNIRASNLMLVQPAVSDGTIKVRNNSSTAVNVILDAEGYLTNPSVLPQAVGVNPTASGSRTAASMISHTSTDRSGVQINPTNGNLLYSQALLNLTGVGQSASVGVRYNALNDARPTLSTGLFESQLYRNGSTGAVTYTASDGAGYVFTPTGVAYTGTDAAGATVTLNPYTVPNGINASLVRVGAGYGPGTEYDLTFHPGQTMNVYADNGSNITLNSAQDVTGANKISYTYAKGALTTITDTQGRTISFAYTSGNNTTQPSTITDNSLGRTITLTYGATSTPANGALTKIVDATGAQTLFGYDPTSGKLSSVTDGRGDVTSFSYDSSNKLTTMTAAAGSSTTTPSSWTMAYPSSTSTKVTDPNSHSNTYTYNSAKQVTGITDARTHTQSKGYNAHNDTTSATTAYNDASSFDTATSTYNLMKITSPSATPGGGGTAGRAQSFTYTTAPSGPGGTYSTADYRPTSVTDTNTNTTSYLYNNFGEPRSMQSAGGAAGTTLRNYQGDTQVSPATSCGGKTGQLCKSTDGKGNVTSYAYNSAGNLTTMTPPAPLGARAFVYDAAGRKVSEQDGRGNTAYTCYDLNDRITQVSYTTAACATVSGVTNTYDVAGNLTSRVTAATGTTVTWTYDAQNRPTMQSDSAGSSSATYDPAGNVLTYTDGGGATTYTYDDTNNVANLAEPGGSCPAGTITPNSTKCTLFTYNDNNKRLTTALPNGVTNTVGYDTSSRTTSVKAVKATTTSVGRNYLYDNSGADSGVIRAMANSVADTNTVYTYDQVNRLAGDTVKTGTAAGTGTVVGSDSYLYDLNGNMTKQVTGGATTYYGYNAADQMCWSANTTGTGCTTPPYGKAFTYDGNGNTLTGDATTGTNTWTNYDQQASTTVGGTQAYTYAGTSNTQRVTAGGATFTNGLLGQVSSQAGGVPNNEYIRDPDGTLIALQTGGNSYYYTLDNIGSVLQLTDNTGAGAATYTYNPYGKTLTAIGPIATQNPYRYASGYTDNTGLIKFGARYYNPTLARFTQPDPSGQETNAYVYAGNNPISNSDPSGLSWGGIFVGALFGAAGLIFAPVAVPLFIMGTGFAVMEQMASDGTLDDPAFGSSCDDPDNC